MKVLKFGAIWCAGCTVMRPRWQEIEKENPWLNTKYFDGDKDFDEFDEMEKWQIKELPVFIFLDKNENEIERLHGEIDKEILVRKIIEHKNK